MVTLVLFSGTATVPKAKAPYGYFYNFSNADIVLRSYNHYGFIKSHHTSMLKGKVKGLTDVLAWFHTTLHL